MARSRYSKSAVLVVALLVLHAAVGPAWAGDQAGGVEVKLSADSGATALRAVTPAKAVHGGNPFRISGDSGSISVGGKPVPFGIRWVETTKAFYGAMDADDNGKLDTKEWVKFSQTMSASYLVKSGGKSYAVRLVDVKVYLRTGGTGISTVLGGCMVLSCQQGSFNGTSIRLYDDNVDGVFTQDGKDAISIGRSTFAIPLMKTHQVASHHYQLEVAEDGTSVTFTPVSGLELGIVELPYRSGIKCLAFADKAGKSYDLAISARTGIPAGSYRLSYGVLTGGGLMTVVAPTEACPTYEIQAGKINVVRIGKPIRVSFDATYAGGNVTVSPRVQVFGAGGEWYKFDYSGGTGRPHVLFMVGSRLLQEIPMKYG